MSTLSSVVSDVVRASQSSTIEDDLDRHVAELILKEAKQKLQKYNTDGIRAYLPQPETNVPKTNKRFLSSIIRNTDDHNKTILRAQALAAQEVRQERLDQEKRERRARAEEAAEAERMRRLMDRTGVEWAHNWGRSKDKERRRRDRSWERGDKEESRHRSRKGKEREHRDDEEERHSRHHRSTSPNREGRNDPRWRYRSERSYSRSASPTQSTEDAQHRRDRKEHRRSHHRRSRRSRSRGHSDTNRYKHSRSHRRHRDRESARRSSSRSRDENDDMQHRQSEDQTTSAPIGDDAQVSNSTDPRLEKGRSSVSWSPSPRSCKRKRSPSPEIGPPPPLLPPSLPVDDNLHADAPREDELRRRLKSRLCPDVQDSTATSRVSTPIPSRASSRPKDAAPTAYISSRTVPSARASSQSAGSRPPSPPPKRSRHRTKTKDAPPQPPSSPPPLPAHLPSKMDKYFDEGYDPRLDVAPLAVPTIPATGLISDAEFAGWDAMLELIRQRREDKEEKKRLERWGLSADKDKKKKSAEGTSEAVNIMSIEYKKRGAVREWDLGKEGF